MFTLPRLIIGGLLAALIVVAVAAGGWWFFIREDNQLATNAPAIPSDLRTPASGATVGATAPAGGATPADAGDAQAYTIISDRSEAAYFADEELASVGLPSTAKGTTTAITGTFYLTPDGLGLAAAPESSFKVDLTTLKSDRDMRDRRVQGMGLETDKYPRATFTAKSVTGYDAAIPEGQEQTLKLTGTLDLHGVQKEMTWDVKARRAGNVMTALATVNFLYSDFGIPVLNIGGFVSVQDDVTLQVQVVAQREE